MKALRDLADLSLEVDPATGALTAQEALKIRLEFGLGVKTDYSFSRERVFRLTDGRVLDRDDLIAVEEP